MHINFSKTRHLFVFFGVTVIFVVIFARLLYIQIIRHKHLSGIADRQHKIFIKLEPRRGNIYDRNKRVLAVCLDAASIYAVPKELDNKEGVARRLAAELGADEEMLLERLKKKSYFAWIKRRVDTLTEQKVKALNIKGIHLAREPKRFYPGGKLACHILGITDVDNKGLEGVELYYDKELTGEYGWRRSSRDAKQREIISFQTDGLPARDGNSIVLTVDEVIQHIIEKETENIVKAYKPKGISIIAMKPKTGEILGLANYPWFDPNDISGVNAGLLKNRAIADSFEPGSVFKIVTASAALEEKTVDFDDEFFCENGIYKVGKRILHDYSPHGTLSFREIIEKSSNIGVAKVAGKLGKEKLAYYIEAFNFGNPTGIDLPGEAQGIVRDPSTWSYVDMTTIPMGQGIAVTALQLACCVSTIANGGIMMQPYVVKKLLSEDGTVVRENKPVVLKRVISKETAMKMKELLEGVIERGTGRRARLADFRAGGKTGTAQKVKPKGGYYGNRYVASFVGFAPYDNPAVALVVCVDEPKKEHLGGRVAAPAFRKIMEKVLAYLGIESDRDET